MDSGCYKQKKTKKKTIRRRFELDQGQDCSSRRLFCLFNFVEASRTYLGIKRCRLPTFFSASVFPKMGKPKQKIHDDLPSEK